MLIPWFQREVSIDEVMTQGHGQALEARLVDPEAESQEQKTYRNELIKLVRTALGKLNERERHIIRNRFGIQGGGESTLEEIAASLSLSRERVRQVERVAKSKLRRVLIGYAANPLIAES